MDLLPALLAGACLMVWGRSNRSHVSALMWREVRATDPGEGSERGPRALNAAGQSWAQRLAGVSAAESPLPRSEGPAVRRPPNSHHGIIHRSREVRGRGCSMTAQRPRRVRDRGAGSSCRRKERGIGMGHSGLGVSVAAAIAVLLVWVVAHFRPVRREVITRAESGAGRRFGLPGERCPKARW